MVSNQTIAVKQYFLWCIFMVFEDNWAQFVHTQTRKKKRKEKNKKNMHRSINANALNSVLKVFALKFHVNDKYKCIFLYEYIRTCEHTYGVDDMERI